MNHLSSKRRSRKKAQPDVTDLQRLVKTQAMQLENLSKEIARLASGEKDRARLRQREEELHMALYDLELKNRLTQLNGGAAPKQIAYVQLIRRIRDVVRTAVPADATVAVVSKGDDELLKLYGRHGMHFPQDRLGRYAGFYPSNAFSAIVQLEAVRSKGADYLLFPSTAFWWLDRYAELKRHLERRYRLVVRDEETCAIYALRQRGPWLDFEDAVAECRQRLNHEPAILDWDTGLDLAGVLPECTVFSTCEKTAALPYLDRTIEIVAVNTNDPALIEEARRVASEAVFNFARDGAGLEWRENSAPAELPAVSIVIPVHNGAALTESCLRSVIETLPANFQGEIIVVDDASTDATAARLDQWASAEKRLKVISNRRQTGLLASAVRGARAATGDLLIFLNHDTIALPGWLPPLLRIFRDFPDAGAAGGRLFFADGSQEEAGAVVFRDGSAAQFGHADHQLDATLYNFVREVDCCSGALLATPRALFEQLGGFDAAYKPHGCEDTDYCFKIREAGRRVYFQPESTVIHVEGGSGVNRNREAHHAKLVKKWSAALAGQPVRPSQTNAVAWRALVERGAK
jgi:GT2 family glycosyltransferase